MMATEKQLSKRKLKLLKEGVKFTIKEIIAVKKWIGIEISLMSAELIAWIFLTFFHSSAFYYLIILLPLITLVYIGFLLPLHEKWWENTKFFSSVKKITSDFRYIYILVHNDKEFTTIIYLMNVLPSTVLMLVISLGTINIMFPDLLTRIKFEYFSIIVSIPFQMLIIFWIILRIVFLGRLSEASKSFAN